MSPTLVPRVAEQARRFDGPSAGGRSSRPTSKTQKRRRFERTVQTHLHRHRPAITR